MSRFFDALREASHSPRLVNEPGPERQEASKSEAKPAPSALPLQKPVIDRTPSGIRLDFAPQALLNMLPPEVESGDHKGEVGTKAIIVLDEKARVIPHAADMAVVEHYRRLRSKILQQQAALSFRTLMVTSPNPQEGKTVTVLNLGFSFAMLPSFKVLVVDGDLRRGSLGKWLGVGDQVGLSNIIEGTATLEDAILKCDNPPLQFMVRGTSKLAAAELLHSPHFNSRLQSMAEHFDLILVDSPPVNLVSDAQELAGSCDAVLLIARAFATKRKSLEQAVQDLSRFRLIGTILNGGTRAQLYNRYNGYY